MNGPDAVGEEEDDFLDGLRLPRAEDLHRTRCDDEEVPTETSDQQQKTEALIEDSLLRFFDRVSLDPELPRLCRRQHIELLERSLHHLSADYMCLDASQPWLCYWMLQSLEVLNHQLPSCMASSVTAFLGRCQDPLGGFGGGPGQLPHLAATYAAVMALTCIGTEPALRTINRPGLSRFIRECHSSDGSFRMHDQGEVDIRGAYCAAAVARLTNVYTDRLFTNTAEWVASCQTYEGGFSGTPGLEAHGGYTLCGLAALALLGRERLCHIDSLMRWVSSRQMSHEGGFSGRTNKLVDSCYAYWQGATFPIIHTLLAKAGAPELSGDRWMFHQEALQQYLLACCERSKGGFVDKPGKHRDFYHTCYSLSGLSIAQNFHLGRLHRPHVIGTPHNQLELVHPIYNITIRRSVRAQQYFSQFATPQQDTSASSSGDEEDTEAADAGPGRPDTGSLGSPETTGAGQQPPA